MEKITTSCLGYYPVVYLASAWGVELAAGLGGVSWPTTLHWSVCWPVLMPSAFGWVSHPLQLSTLHHLQHHHHLLLLPLFL